METVNSKTVVSKTTCTKAVDVPMFFYETCFFLLSEGVVTNCSQPNCLDELEAAACPPDSIPDPNSPDNGCICADKCPPPQSCIPPAVSHLQRPATREPSSCCDLYECISPPEKNCSQVVCDKVEQPPCPPDSNRLPAIKSAEECCSVPQGCQCSPEPCRPPECKPPLWAKVIRPGNEKPGSCCPLYKCVENESNETCTLEDGRVVHDGATWRKSECTMCTCKSGNEFCKPHPPCPPIPDDCSKTKLPEGKCCAICLERPEPHQKGCISGTGEIVKNGDSWQEDDCTFCVCQNGEKKCRASMCEACANPRYVPHECCPVCDKSSVVTLPPHCLSLSNCSLRCVHGFVRDSGGCFTCQCQQNVCELECPQGYAEDKNGNKLCECAKTTLCPPMTNCKKNCPHGFRLNKSGCPQCKCDSCKPLVGCSKKCPHGLMTNQNNCPICKCLPFGSSETSNTSFNVQKEKVCSSDGIVVRDDGEVWFDGCRQCYCMAGLEMCSPLLCPSTNCPSQLLNTSGCCPVCPGPHESVKRHMICGGSDGTDSLRIEGEKWNLSSDVTCVCQGGRTLCHAPPCPPAPCHYQSMTLDLGCPHCSLQLLNSTFQLSTNCEGHYGVTVWRENNCISCLCDGVQPVCFTEVCSSEPCNHPLHLKGHCCPICLDKIEKGNKMATFEVTETTKDISDLGCVVQQNNLTRLYKIAEEWRESDCITCQCIGQGQTLCTKETCILPSTCTKPVKTPGACCHTCLNSGAGTGALGNETVNIVIVIVMICTIFIIIYFIARKCRLRRQMKLSTYGCPPPQYQYKFVPSYETPQSQSIRTTEKSALSPV
ncbi:reduction in Cnn dots 2 [Lycorma delicatula]|uniref:reduction in Cnn dots 2 n=1 Tax=Lycorma delicatula TaxID=130591 RepID=UPI003F51A331